MPLPFISQKMQWKKLESITHWSRIVCWNYKTVIQTALPGLLTSTVITGQSYSTAFTQFYAQFPSNGLGALVAWFTSDFQTRRTRDPFPRIIYAEVELLKKFI